MKTMIQVSSLKPRRRAGMRFGPDPVVLNLDDLTEDQVSQLDDDPKLTIRGVKADAKADPKPEKNDGPATPEARAEAIREAVGQLGPDDFTKSGKPGIEPLEKLLDWKPSRAEVTAAVPEEPPGE